MLKLFLSVSSGVSGMSLGRSHIKQRRDHETSEMYQFRRGGRESSGEGMSWRSDLGSQKCRSKGAPPSSCPPTPFFLSPPRAPTHSTLSDPSFSPTPKMVSQLFQAAESGDLEAVRQCLKESSSVDIEIKGESSLKVARPSSEQSRCSRELPPCCRSRRVRPSFAKVKRLTRLCRPHGDDASDRCR